MMSRKNAKRLAAIVAILLAAIMVFSAVASGIVYAQAASSISGLKQQLGEISEKQKQLKSEIAALNGKIDSVSEQKAKLDQQMELTQDKIDATEEIIRQLNAQIEQKTEELAQAERDLQEKSDLFATRIRVMYENGDITYLDVLLESNDLEDMMSRMTIISNIMDYDKKVVAEFKAAKEDIEVKKAALEVDQREQKTYQDSLQSQYNDLDAQADKQKAILAELNSNVDAKKAEEEKMQAEQESINSEIARLSAEAAKAAKEAAERAARAARAAKTSSGSSASTAAVYSEPSSGTFTWPLPGYGSGAITSPYGYRIHPITGKRKLHAGVDLGAPKGTQIVAAASGTVVKSYMSSSYGNYTVISHGNGIMTAYAHQSKRLVSEGDTVSAGQVIGTVGSTGNSTGNHLHFEVYVNGSTVNPMKYFG